MAYYLKYHDVNEKKPIVKRYVHRKARDKMYYRMLLDITTTGLIKLYQGA
ncbi:hypothetical protein VPHD260_0207 [Vibrio phage D260]